MSEKKHSNAEKLEEMFWEFLKLLGELLEVVGHFFKR